MEFYRFKVLFDHHLLWGIGALVVAAIIPVLAWRWWRLRHIPGPPLALLYCTFGLSRTGHRQEPHEYAKMIELSHKYGKLFRIGPNQLVLTELDASRRVLLDSSTGPLSNPTASFSPLGDEENTLEWNAIGMGPRQNIFLDEVVESQCSRLTDMIESEFVSTSAVYRPLKLMDMANDLSTDVLGELHLPCDIRNGNQKSKDSLPAVERSVHIASVAAVIAGFRWVLRSTARSLHMRILGSVGTVEAFSCAVTRSGAILFCSTLMQTITTPSVYDKLQTEINCMWSDAHVSSRQGYSEHQELSYLEAVINEGLRMYPTVTSVTAKAPKGGYAVSKFKAPEGTVIIHNIAGIMRASTHWGEDADVFRPERWVNATPENYKAMHEALQLGWGTDRYRWLREAYARLHLKRVLLLSRYDFAVVAPRNPVEIMGTGFLESDLQLRITRKRDRL
ncbi:uncharacterized protein JN550_000933 [Neoarthrinium moseri]|uniref:uncharacterized protein n=1 Tax=Neoarthrinium moseri TaxID=1658444 RepID=UPI001FDB7F2D|nr:uncharacterized protein JN550_000933 [Neoarthrinium moseri]KAI1876861.1 hypothetical protein JN550_000933 [Neoarthrinium moseri]